MAFQAVPDCAVLIVEMGSATLQWTNSLHVEKPGFTTGEMEDLAQAVWIAWAETMMDQVSSAYYLRQVTAYDLRADGAPVFVYAGTPVQGASTSSRLCLQDALVVTLYTATRGRSGRGRMYLAGYTEEHLIAGDFNSTLSTAVLANLGVVEDAIDGEGFDWVVVSRYHDGLERSVGVAYPITSYTVRSLIPGNQERRSRRP